MIELVIGIAIGAAFSPLWVKVGSYLWSLVAKKEPALAAEAEVVGSVVSSVAAPIVAAATDKIPPAK